MTHEPFNKLDAHIIKDHLDKPTQTKLHSIHIFDSVSSTNDVLWSQVENGNNQSSVCLSETQTSGRGRRGDQWMSPASGNLYLSILWPFPADMTHTGLSIAIGITLIDVLKSEGINDLQLKWPNDILHKRQKLAGILVESRFGKVQNTIIGIGLNFKLPADTKKQIQQPTTSLERLTSSLPCRNRLAGKIIQNMITLLERFQASGLEDYLARWPSYDAFANQTVKLITDESSIEVEAKGINENGEFIYSHNNQLHTLSSSHVSIRFAS